MGKAVVALSTLSPHNNITGGKVRGARTIPSNSRVANALRMAAMNVSRCQTALGFHRRTKRPPAVMGEVLILGGREGYTPAFRLYENLAYERGGIRECSSADGAVARIIVQWVRSDLKKKEGPTRL